MARTKTQKTLTLSKTKSEYIFNFLNEVAPWKKLSETLNYGKTKIFKLKKEMVELAEENDYFYSLSAVFTLMELNKLIELYNDYIENPEQYNTRKTSKKEDIEEQKTVVNKYMKEMNMPFDGDITTEKEEPRTDFKEYGISEEEKAKREKAYREKRTKDIDEFWKNKLNK